MMPPRSPSWVRSARFTSLVDVAQFLLLAGFLLWLALSGAQSMGYRWQWYRVPQYLVRVVDGELIFGPLLRGLAVTLEISLWSLLLTIVIGLVTALLRISDSLSGRVLARVYLELIRNTPLLVQLYLFYFVLAPVLGIGRFWTGILCLAFFEGSFAAEIIRSGILSVPKGQWEAADSLGLPPAAKYRLVVLPQALQLMLPPLTGLAVSLIKNSSIVSVIAIFDLTNEGRNVIADTFMSFEIWFTVAAIYLLFTVALSTFVGRLEQRLKRRR